MTRKSIIKHGKPTKWQWTIWYPEKLKLGKNIDIGAGCHIFCQNGVEIGDDVQIGGGTYIYSKSTIDGKEGKVTIGRGARIGAQSLIMPGVTIGRNAIIGAQSFVKKDVGTGLVVYGVIA